jgi:hypothetical protein
MSKNEVIPAMKFLASCVLISGISFSLLQSVNASSQEQFSSLEKSGKDSLSQAATQPRESIAPEVGATQPVITVHGLCSQGRETTANDATACSKTINREQFENLVSALNPDGQTLPPNGRQNLARTYSEYLAVESAARTSGLEDTPQFREFMEWVRLRTITELYRRKMQEKYRAPSQEEITAYYKQHFPEYETVKLVRILIPRESSSGQNKDEFDKKAREAANAAQERAVKGDEPLQIQKDAYTALGLAVPPPTDLGIRRRTELVQEEATELFSLKPGEVTQVKIEPKSYVIYKVLSKDAVPEDQVKADISKEIYQKKFKDAMKAVIDAAPAEFNQEYFGAGMPGATSGKPLIAPSTSPAH